MIYRISEIVADVDLPENQDFKTWKDTGPICLAPSKAIFGANSAGKSSLGHLLLALQRTGLSTDPKRALQLSDATS